MVSKTVVSKKWKGTDMETDKILKKMIDRRVAVGKILAMNMRSLAFDLNRVAESIEKNDSWPVNTLGEVQGRGSEIDVLCAKFGIFGEIIKDLKEAY